MKSCAVMKAPAPMSFSGSWLEVMPTVGMPAATEEAMPETESSKARAFFGRDASLLQRGDVRGWIRLHSLDLVGEHDDIEEVPKLQGEQYRLDVLLRRVGDEGDPHPSLFASL